MKISLNGAIPTLDQLEALFAKLPDEFNLGEFQSYAGNIEWKDMCIVWGDQTLHCAGYTGIWALASYDRQSNEGKLQTLSELLDWMEWHYKLMPLNIELFKGEED